MTAKRPSSDDGDEDIERNNNTTTTTRQEDHKDNMIDGSNREEDGGEYGDEGFESDAGISADRCTDDGGGLSVRDGADVNVDGHVEGGGSVLTKTASDDGDFFQIDDDSDEAPAVSLGLVERGYSKGSQEGPGRQNTGTEGGEKNNSTGNEGHSPKTRVSVDDNDGDKCEQSQPGSDDPEEGAAADGDYSSPPPRRRPSFGDDNSDNRMGGSHENAEGNKTAIPAYPRSSSDDARLSQENKTLAPEGAGRASDNATADILSPAPVVPEALEIAYGDLSATRKADSRGSGIGSYERRQSQENTGEGRRGSKRSSVDLGTVSSLKRERQERMIQQLAHDNDVLKRKVAGFQLALQLSADEDGFCTSPSFSAAFSVAPPAFPRDGGPPAPSPRVARGWTHQTPPARRVSPTMERDLSYTSLVRQLDTGERRARTLRRTNENLGARVNELESGAILRATQAKLAEREEDIAALREELAVMQRLARAQDRKFEGSAGYAMARRLWAAEEELRLARSTASALGGEVVRLRNARKSRRRQVQNRVPGDPQNTDTSAVESQRCSTRRHRRLVARRKSGADKSRHGSGGTIKGGDSDGGRDNGRRGSEGGSLVREKGSAGENGEAVRSDRGRAKVARGVVVSGGGERFNNNKGAMEVKADLLQRALENMRSKAKGELRTATLDIDGLKQENAGLTQALMAKAKEVRLQVLQVSRLKRELRDLSAGTAKLEEATFAFAPAANSHANSRATTRAVASAAAGVPSLAAGAGTLGAERRLVKSAAATVSTTSTSGRRCVPSNSLSTVRRRNPHPAGGALDDRRQPAPTRLVSGHEYFPVMRWNQDWDEGRTPPLLKAVPDDKLSVAAAGGRDVGRAGSSAGGGGDGSKRAVCGATKRDERQEISRPETEGEASAQRQKTASFPTRRASRFPCPLSGILDMSEPAPHERRSVYSDGGSDAASLPKTGTVPMGPDAPRGDGEAIGCFIDSDGFVRHSKRCAMSEVVEDTSSTKRFALERQLTGNDGGQLDSSPESRPPPVSTGEVQVCDGAEKEPTTSTADTKVAGRATAHKRP